MLRSKMVSLLWIPFLANLKMIFFPFRDGRLAEFLFDSKKFFSDKMLAG